MIQTPQNQTVPPWIPDAILRHLPHGKPVTISARLSEGERLAIRKRKPIRVSIWAERHRVVTMSSRPGPWRNDLTPYLTGIMDALAFPSVRTGILCKAPQVGGSEGVNNFIGSRIDRDPGPALYVFPESNTARENSQDRILPMIESSPNLSQHLTGWEDDKTSFRIKLRHMPIYMAWAGSASRLANKPIMIVVFDETDKYPPASKREADPITLGEKRVITYPYDHKIIKISTPTVESGPISVAMETEAQVVFDYWVECPGCGEIQPMVFDQIKWDKVEGEDGKKEHPDPERMKALQLAWYECPHCQCQWDDGWRDKAASNGEWRSRTTKEEKQPLELEYYLKSRRPTKIGFHIPSWISSLVSMSAAAAAFIKGRHDLNARKDFWNAHKAEAYKPKISPRKEDDILALRDDRDRGVVPSEPLIGLTAVVDTQDDGFWYEIRAWGPYPNQESWQVRDGFAISVHAKDFAALEKMLFHEVYKDLNGVVYPVQLVWIDTAGHRTGEVYDWCRKHYPRVWGLKGHERMASAWKWDKPGEKHRKKGRDIKLYGLNVNHYKDLLANRLKISPADPGAWHLHRETTFDWAKQMCSEVYNDDKNIWEVINNRANHAWDISGYHMAMADIVLRNWPLASEQKKKKSDGAKPVKVAKSKFMS
jgi:phage terminase large subunit GpA-like protein